MIFPGRCMPGGTVSATFFMIVASESVGLWMLIVVAYCCGTSPWSSRVGLQTILAAY